MRSCQQNFLLVIDIILPVLVISTFGTTATELALSVSAGEVSAVFSSSNFGATLSSALNCDLSFISEDGSAVCRKDGKSLFLEEGSKVCGEVSTFA
jgi:hypothetical protein